MFQRFSDFDVSQANQFESMFSYHLHHSTYSAMCCGNFLGSISTRIGLLTALESLHLQSNLLTGIVPTQIGRLTALNELRLQFNQFTGTLPSEMSRLTRLSRFLVNNNALFGPIPTIPSQISFCQLGDSPMPMPFRNCFMCNNLPVECRASCQTEMPCLQPAELTNGPRTTPFRPSIGLGTISLMPPINFTLRVPTSGGASTTTAESNVSVTVALEESMTDMESGPISVKLITIIAASVGGFLLVVGVTAVVVCVVCTRRAKRDARIFAVTSSNAARKAAAADQYSSGDVVNFGTTTSAGTQSTSASNTSSYASAGFASARDEYDSGNVYL
jgi:hypothetical protein